MRPSLAAAAGVLLIVLSAPAPGLAQPAAGTIFVTATAIAAIEQAPGTKATGLFDTMDDGGTVAGGGLAVGVHLSPRLSLRLEAQASGELRTDGAFPGILASTPVFEGVIPIQVEQTMTSSRTATPVFALLGYHWPGRRLSAQVVGGLGLVRQSRTSSFTSRLIGMGIPVGIPVNPVRSEVTTTSYDAVAVVGADLAWALGARLSLVPQVRAYVLDSGLSLRPGLGVRWTF